MAKKKNERNGSSIRIDGKEVFSDPGKNIPKFTNVVNFNKLDNGNILMAFFAQGMQRSGLVLVETIMIDEGHAKNIGETLLKIVNEDR